MFIDNDKRSNSVLVVVPHYVIGRDAKTYKRANNVCVKKNPISGKIFAKFYALLSRK